MKEALVLMAKAPVAGDVKTRLLPILTVEEAQQLYTAFLNDTFSLMEGIRQEREDLHVVLCYTPEGAEEAFELVEREGSLMIAQRGRDLGERLTHCFQELFAKGFDSVVAIGADSPTLPGENIYDAFEILEEEDVIVIGPTEDSGYYLIGMRRLHPRLFVDIPWSTDGVMAATIDRAREGDADLILLPEWYDVDTPDDLERLKQELRRAHESAGFTKRFLKQLNRKTRGES